MIFPEYCGRECSVYQPNLLSLLPSQGTRQKSEQERMKIGTHAAKPAQAPSSIPVYPKAPITCVISAFLGVDGKASTRFADLMLQRLKSCTMDDAAIITPHERARAAGLVCRPRAAGGSRLQELYLRTDIGKAPVP